MINLQNEYHINKFHKIYFYIDDENDKIKLEPFKLILNLNFDYICDKNHYDKIIEKIEKDEYKDELYKKYIIYLNEEKIYKVIIDQYINLFDKSIYGKKKESSKNEQLLNKINQDIQFFQNFEINNNITLNTETKTAINNLFNEEIIKKIINEFIDQKNILNEIEDILLNFENEIQEKIKANKNQLDSNVINNKDKNEGNNKNKEKNKKENISEGNNENNEKDIEKINNINNNENLIENIDENAGKNLDENLEESSDEKEIENLSIKNTNNTNDQNDENNNVINENASKSYQEIKECEKLLEEKREGAKIEKIKSENNEKFMILIGNIKEKLKKIFTNDILLVIYIILQKSIIDKLEHLFVENFSGSI